MKYETGPTIRALGIALFLSITPMASSCTRTQEFTPFELKCVEGLRANSASNPEVLEMIDAKNFRIELTPEIIGVYSAKLRGGGWRATTSFIVGDGQSNCSLMGNVNFLK